MSIEGWKEKGVREEILGSQRVLIICCKQTLIFSFGCVKCDVYGTFSVPNHPTGIQEQNIMEEVSACQSFNTHTLVQDQNSTNYNRVHCMVFL